MNEVLSCAIAIVVMDSYMRTIDWKLFKIGAAMTVELGV
jgi:hypothetical protein